MVISRPRPPTPPPTLAGRGTDSGRSKAAYGLPGVLHLPDAEVLQRDDPPRLLILRERSTQPASRAARGPCRRGREPATALAYRRVFEVIEAVVREDEPPPLPGLHAPACKQRAVSQSRAGREPGPDLHRRPSPEGHQEPSLVLFPSS